MTENIKDLKTKIEHLELKVSILENQLIRALDLVANSPGDPESTIVKSRVILEKVTKDLYTKVGVEIPKKATELGGMINNNQFTNKLPSRIVLRMNSVREFGNLGAHDKGPVSESDAIDCIKCLIEVLEWYCETYIDQKVSEKGGGKGAVETLTKPAVIGLKKKGSLRQIKVVVAISITLLLFIGVLLTTMNLSKKADNKKTDLESLIAKGISRDIQAALKVAYSTRLKGDTPAAAINILAKQGADPEEPWRILQEGQTLSSKDSYKIMFCPENQAYFYVIQIDSRGKLDWLFPANGITRFSVGHNPVPPNVWTSVPGETTGFYLDENIGMEHLYVIVTSKRWDEYEKTLGKSASAAAGAEPIQASFNLKTRGAGGARMVPAPSLENNIETTKDIRRLMTGKDGILVYEKWFQHVGPK
jgi:hypothetical protein